MLREDSDTVPTAKWQTVPDQWRGLMVLREILKVYLVFPSAVFEDALMSTF
jgi:hypothetical protein